MIEYDRGIHLLGTDLWFDSKKKAEFSFISNADAGRFVPPGKIISTPETIRLIEKKIKESVVLACPYYRPFSLGSMQVELIPSGYMPGSAQIAVNNGEKTIIYTGDINLRQSFTAVPAHVKRCQILILKCTMGAPKYVFPPPEEVIGSLTGFIESTLSSGSVPVILADPLGKAEEITKVLSEKGYRPSVHKSIYKTVKIYEELGIGFSSYELFRAGKADGKVVIFPPHKGKSKSVEKIKNKRIAVITETAPDEQTSVKKTFNADEAFSLSSRAGFDELLRYVDLVRPERVYLVHGHTTELARALQKRGYDAVPLEKPAQLKLL